MLRQALWAVGLFLAVATSAEAKSISKKPIGTKVQGTAEIGHARVPLPDGEWVLFGKMAALSSGRTNGVLVHRVFLAQIKDDVLAGAVLISANVEGIFGGWRRDPDCDRVDMHYAEADKNFDTRNRACFWVNHITTAVTNNTLKSTKDAYAYMDRNGIRRPSTVVAVLYSIAKGSNFVQATYWFNPEVDGFAPSKATSWLDNDWHKSQIVDDPKKMAYVEKLKSWGAALFPRIKTALGR